VHSVPAVEISPQIKVCIERRDLRLFIPIVLIPQILADGAVALVPFPRQSTVCDGGKDGTALLSRVGAFGITAFAEIRHVFPKGVRQIL